MAGCHTRISWILYRNYHSLEPKHGHSGRSHHYQTHSNGQIPPNWLTPHRLHNHGLWPPCTKKLQFLEELIESSKTTCGPLE